VQRTASWNGFGPQYWGLWVQYHMTRNSQGSVGAGLLGGG